MKLTLDIYYGSGIAGDRETITVSRTRDGIAACRRRAARIWGSAVVCHPADDDIVSFGPGEGRVAGCSDGYVTLRRCSE